MKFEKIKAVIFDKDGTLIDIHKYWCRIIELRASMIMKYVNSNALPLFHELVTCMGGNADSRKLMPDGPVGNVSREEVIEIVVGKLQNNFGAYRDCATRDRIAGIFNKCHSLPHIFETEHVVALPGVISLLKGLRSRKMRAAAISMDTTQAVRRCLDTIGVRKYFDEIYGKSEKNPMPKSKLSERFMAKFGLNPNEIMMIGDTVGDGKMAKGLGSISIGVSNGMCSKEVLQDSGFFDLVVDDLTQFQIGE